jgi:large subunit ribosomal protein L1
MRKRSKRYKQLLSLYDRSKRYNIDEAVEILKKFSNTKFDQTVNLSIKLNIDPQKADQQVRGFFSLPHGIGKVRKVLVFADGEDAQKAKDSGADFVGAEEFVKKIRDENWFEFDVALAVPRMMRLIGPLGKLLGPRGLMPSSKDGTVTDRIEEAVKDCKHYRVMFRNDRQANLHVPVGKLSSPAEKIKQNILSFLEHLRSQKPSGARGQFIKNITVSASMSPSIKLTMVTK